LNARVKLRHDPEAVAAADFLAAALGVRGAARIEGRARRIAARTVEHLQLVALSLAAAVIVAVPLGIAAARRPRGGQLVLGMVGLVQTIPSLALLVFMIPLLGIGSRPAIAGR